MAEKKCNNCGTDKTPANVPFAVYESVMARAERQAKRLVAVIILLIVLLVGSNICWIVYENSFDDMTETYTVEQDGAETNNSVINGGEIVNGEAND